MAGVSVAKELLLLLYYSCKLSLPNKKRHNVWKSSLVVVRGYLVRAIMRRLA